MATATAARAAPNVARTSAGGRGRLLGRAIIVLAALAASGAVLCLGIATSLARHDPIEAAQIAPDNAEIAVAAARARAGKDTVHQNREVRRLVAAALARDVTDPTSIELKSLQSGADGDHLREARLITLSDAISRRSLPTRLWLIQQAVNKGDLVGALKNFDTALRTSSDAPGVLFPALSRAASDPSLAVPVAQLLDRPSDWRLPFLHFAITDGDAASGVAGIVLHMRHRDWMTGDDLDGALVAELVSEEYFTQALAVQDSFHPVTERSALVRDPAFADPRARYPFGWLFEQKGDIGAERGPELSIAPGWGRTRRHPIAAAEARVLPAGRQDRDRSSGSDGSAALDPDLRRRQGPTNRVARPTVAARQRGQRQFLRAGGMSGTMAHPQPQGKRRPDRADRRDF